MSPNRIVAVLTPIVFAPAAGAASAWLAKHVPGTSIKSSDLQAIFIAGALIALAPAAQWLHGWQKHEARQADAEHAIELATATGANVPVLAAATPVSGEAEDDDLTALLDLGDGDGDIDEDLILGEAEPAGIQS